jgi:hypothetical protein
MTVNSMKPTFTNREGYLAWRKTWRVVYKKLSSNISRSKSTLRYLQREGDANAPRYQKELHLKRRDATKMMTLLDEAKLRRDRIISMHEQIASQPFPLEMTADRVDFHYNKGSNEFPFLPRWVLKTKGKSFYVDHIDAEIGWTTRELDTGNTPGMIRFRKCVLSINDERLAVLRAIPTI